MKTMSGQNQEKNIESRKKKSENIWLKTILGNFLHEDVLFEAESHVPLTGNEILLISPNDRFRFQRLDPFWSRYKHSQINILKPNTA